jgi:hypothetical protein
MTVTMTTSATSLTTGGVLGQGHQPLHDALQEETSLHYRVAVSMLWLHYSGRSFSQKSSRPDMSTNMMAPVIQVYHTVIKAAGGDDRVKVNYLPTTLSSAARS